MTQIVDGLDISIFKNFLEIKDCDSLLSECLSLNPEDWEGVSDEFEGLVVPGSKIYEKYIYWKETWSNTGHRSNNTKIINSLKSKVSNMFDDSFYITDEIYNLKKFSTGKKIDVHYDSVMNIKLKYGVIYYINDNYSGGELYYPELNFQIKPERNSLIIHPADKEYAHGVKEVKSGDRYSIAFFISKK